MTNLKEEIKRLENYHKWWKFWNWGGLKKDRVKEMIETYQELINYQELIKMETKTKKIQTIEDCETLADIRKGIESIMDQHDIMQARVDDYKLTRSSMIESLMWFLDPVESEGRKDDS